jgi:RNA polymerase sigma-70 factor (ECF subfamily)
MDIRPPVCDDIGMWPEATDTQELLTRAKDGEDGAVDQLLARHREPLRRMIALRLDAAIARRVDPSDVVQEVLLEVSRRLDEYLKNPTMPFHLWLRHIAKDRMIDAHRRHRQAQRRSLDREQPMHPAPLVDGSSLQLLASLVDQELTPASAAIRQELERRFWSEIAQLDEDDREIILMRHFEQLSNQDAADALGLSQAAAGMRYMRAMRRLRARMQPGSE